jgi:hypothetical protein
VVRIRQEFGPSMTEQGVPRNQVRGIDDSDQKIAR